MHYDGKVSTAPAPAETEADDKPPRGRHSDARERLDGPDHDAQRNVSPDQRQVSAPRGDRGRDPGSAPGRLAGRITSQVVGFDRWARSALCHIAALNTSSASPGGAGAGAGGPTLIVVAEEHLCLAATCD